MATERTGNPVKRLREERGWTQRQLADDLDLTIGTISAIENGKRPSLDTALRLASVFGIPVEGLFTPEASTGEVQESPMDEALAGAAAPEDPTPASMASSGRGPVAGSVGPSRG